MDAPFGLGAHPSPEAEKETAWTLASVGAPTTYPDAAFIEQVKELFITNQGKIGSCVGNTFQEIVQLITLIATGSQQQLSWRFVYAVCKCLEGTAGYEMYAKSDEGTYPALAAIVIRKYGAPLAIHCPNDVTLSHEDFVYQRKLANIPVEAFQNALSYKSGVDLTEPVSADGIKKAINYAAANKGGVAILRRIGDTYWVHNGVTTYDKALLVPIPPTSAIVSGHEELLYGYDIDPANGRTRIYWQNHWSTQWCSTGGVGTDGGRAWEYLDVWLPYIVELRVVLPALPTPPDNFKYNFTKQLTDGATGADVVALQHVLSIENCYTYTGTPLFTGNYGSYTHAGVKALQEKYAAEILKPLGLTVGTGKVGASTLAWLQKHYQVTK